MTGSTKLTTIDGIAWTSINAWMTVAPNGEPAGVFFRKLAATASAALSPGLRVIPVSILPREERS